jgi:hypothetical protein
MTPIFTDDTDFNRLMVLDELIASFLSVRSVQIGVKYLPVAVG